jgi:hypothetical protein
VQREDVMTEKLKKRTTRTEVVEEFGNKAHAAKPDRKAAARASDAAGQLAKYHEDPVAYTTYKRWHGAKYNAKAQGLPFDLAMDDVRNLIEEALSRGCAVTRRPVKLYPPPGVPGTKSEQHDDAVSLDKLEPSLGYVKGNVRAVCWAYNKSKNDMTPHHMTLEVALRGANPFPLESPQGHTLHILGKAIRKRSRRALMIPMNTIYSRTDHQ